MYKQSVDRTVFKEAHAHDKNMLVILVLHLLLLSKQELALVRNKMLIGFKSSKIF